jgi:hypothetical protein
MIQRTRLLSLACIIGAIAGCFMSRASATGTPRVTLLKTPNGGIQPQVVTDDQGVIHLLYYKGDPGAGDLFYVHRAPGQAEWSAPLRVNSEPGSAVAVGTIRGGQIAIGKAGRVHVAWNGSRHTPPRVTSGPNASLPGYAWSPMLYTRLNDAGTGFEPQRNLMQFTFMLDGGGTLAADRSGNVYVAWHGQDGSGEGEGARRMWVARSTDDGKTFSPEVAAFAEPTGACGCCGTRAFTDDKGTVYLLYRSAKEKVNRDMYLLVSRDQGKSYRGALIQRWKVPG